MNIAEAAAFLAPQWPVFPCDARKRPVTAHGFKDAVTTPEEARALFRKPGAVMIGVPAGRASGLLVIDLDVKNGGHGLEWLAANEHRIPRTRRHRTQSGGVHLLFKHPADRIIRNSSSRIAPNVDVRTDGGYIIVPPSQGYTIADDTMPAEAPAWLLDILDPPKPAAAPYTPPPRATGDATPYGAAALERAATAILNAADGAKHDTLNREAYSIGGLVAAGEIPEGEGRRILESALAGIRHRCDDFPAAQRTLAQAFRDGMAQPRAVPPPRLTRRVIEEYSPPPGWEEPPPIDEPPPHWGAEPDYEPEPEAETQKAEKGALTATPFDATEFDGLAPRKWVYGHFLIERFLSVLGAPGGTGKTAYAMGVAVSVALNKPLLGEQVHKPGNVWLYNLEDPRDEILRRLYAVCIEHRIPATELAGRLFIDSGREKPLVVAERTQDGRIVAMPVVDELVAELRARGIRLLIVDPFVKSHRLEENRNEQIDFAASLWNAVAERAECAIMLVHHFRKGGTAGDADAFRGASALVDAARAAVALSTMSEKDADRLGIEDDKRRFYVRADNAKLNLAPPPSEAVWVRLNNVELPNGDRVQAVSRWEPPSPWGSLPMRLVVQILDRIAAGRDNGDLWSPRKEARDGWAGAVIVDTAAMTEGQAVEILRAWEQSTLLTRVEFKNSDRQKRQGYAVDATKIAEMRRQIKPEEGDT